MTYSAQQWLRVCSSIDIWIFTIILCGVFPIAGYMLFRNLKNPAKQNRKSRKLRTYISIMGLEWAFVAALIWISHRHSLSPEELGEKLVNVKFTAIITTILLAVFAVMVYFNIRQLRQMKPEKLETELSKLKMFLPGNKAEFFIFFLIAITAGICEELLYRGWLQNLFIYTTGYVWIGLISGAVIFGIGHVYQGKMGMIQTGIIGLIFGAVFIFTGSLIAGQILHTAIDAVNGIVGYYALSLLKFRSQETADKNVT